jgi:hypothetical protein
LATKYWARADLIRFQAADHVHEREIKPEVLDQLGVAKRGRRKSVDVSLSISDYEPVFTIDCPQCAPLLRDDPRFAANPDKLPLTPDEETRKKRDEQEGNVLTRLMAQAMANAAAEAVNKARQG